MLLVLGSFELTWWLALTSVWSVLVPGSTVTPQQITQLLCFLICKSPSVSLQGSWKFILWLALWYSGLSHCLPFRHPIWAPVLVLVYSVLTQVPFDNQGKQQRMVQVLGPLYLHGTPGWSSWFQFDPPHPSCCNHLGELADESLLAFSLSLSLFPCPLSVCNSIFQIK